MNTVFSRGLSQMREVDAGDIASWPHWMKVLGAILVGILVLVLFTALLYGTQLTRIKNQNTQIESLKQQLVQKHKQSVSLPLYVEQMKEIQRRFDVVSKQLPNETEIPALLTDISQAGIDNGLEFKRFQPKPHVQQDFFVKVPIQIKAVGSYHELAKFISDIANFQRIVNIGNFNITRDKRSEQNVATRLSEEPELEFDAEIMTYHYQGNDAGMPEADKPRVVRPGLQG